METDCDEDNDPAHNKLKPNSQGRLELQTDDYAAARLVLQFATHIPEFLTQLDMEPWCKPALKTVAERHQLCDLQPAEFSTRHLKILDTALCLATPRSDMANEPSDWKQVDETLHRKHASASSRLPKATAELRRRRLKLPCTDVSACL
ncbi:hypothetical protein WJX72_002227 [[Myrmecia] bisecta]|uniref:Uncharacterized protein n=1 Tax=[Myrmecia] bisecta TaxID=41462 RepID=A0AAW1PDK4_9CHLO